jgi:lipoprotein-anchoring transpeptidase ErfK/SrfK
MKRNRLSAKTLRSKALSLGAALALVALGAWELPAFAWKTNVETQPEVTSQVLLARQQRKGRWIEIDLSAQRLTAWNGGKRVRSFMVSTGKQRTPTRVGTFAVQTKLRRTRMRGRGYDVPNVPYVMYYSGGYALHGAYWHNRFGTPVSHGCVNLRTASARWLYNWASVGTPVVIRR